MLLTTLSTRDEKQLTRRCTLDLDVQSNHGQPDSCRARPVKVDDGLEDVMWIRDLGGEGLHALSLLHPHKKRLFEQSERNRALFLSVFYTPAAKCCYQTVGRHPPHMTGHLANIVTLYRVGRSPSRACLVRGVIVILVDRCLSRSRNLAVPNEKYRQLFQADFLSQHPPRIFAFGFAV